MKRTLALLTSAALLLGTAACGRREQKSGATLEISLDHAYTGTCITQIHVDPWEHFEDRLMSGEPLCATAEKLLLSYGSEYTDSLTLYSYDLKTGQAEPFEPEILDAHRTDTVHAEPSDPALLPDGGVLFLYTDMDTKTYSPTDAPHWMERYDSSLNLVESRALPADFCPEEEIHTLVADSDGYLYIILYNNRANSYYIRVIAPSFDTDADIPLPDVFTCRLIGTEDGSVYIRTETRNGDVQLSRIDRENRRCEPLDIPDAPWSLFRGNASYPFVTFDQEGIFGMDTDGSRTLLTRWTSSDFSWNDVDSDDLLLLDDGRIVLNENVSISVSSNSISYTEQWLLHPRTDKELHSMKLLSLATVGVQSVYLSEAVTRFNRQSEDTHIVLVDYSTYNTEEDNTLGLAKLRSDMLDGTVADIICTDGLPTDLFQKKGLLEDLSERLAADETITDEHYLMNFFDALRCGSTMPEIAFSYRVETLAAKQAYVGDASGLDIASFLALTADMPEDMELFVGMDQSGPDQRTMLDLLCLKHLGSFVDAENGTCRFDTPEFLRVLELAAACEPYDPDRWQHMSQSELELYISRAESAFLRDTALFCETYLNDPYAWHELREGTFGDAPITMVGYPDDAGSNGAVFVPDYRLAVYTQSRYQDEAWEFFRYLLSSDYQSTCFGSLPVSREVLADKMEEAMSPLPDPFNSGGTRSRTYYLGNQAVVLQNADEEEMADFLAYLEQTTTAEYHNETIESILFEETDMYFAGDQTAEETAAYIQSRVSLYLNE